MGPEMIFVPVCGEYCVCMYILEHKVHAFDFHINVSKIIRVVVYSEVSVYNSKHIEACIDWLQYERKRGKQAIKRFHRKQKDVGMADSGKQSEQARPSLWHLALS